MKIIQVIHSLEVGGAEKITVELSNELARDHKVLVCTFKEETRDGKVSGKLNNTVDFISLGINSKYSVRILYRLYKLIRMQKPDVIHVHLHNSFYYVFVLSLISRKIRFVHTIHNELFAWEKIMRIASIVGFFRKNLIHVCISKNIYQQFKATFPKSKFVQIDNGILPPGKKTESDPSFVKWFNGYKQNEISKVFVAIGNFAPFKRFDLLIETFSCLSDSYTLIIIGGDDISKKQNLKISGNRIPKNVILTGCCDNVFPYLMSASALLVSSSREGMPLVVLEAFSVGLPVISTPAGGIPDMVEDGINGFLARDFTKDALLEAINNFLNCNQEQVDKIKKNNIKKFNENYTIEICAKNYLSKAYKGKI